MRWNSIILARSGSKRLPGKNFSVELLPGETLLERAVRKAAEVFGKTCVSSDREEVASIAARMGAGAIISPHHEDRSSSVDAVLYAADVLGWNDDSAIALVQLTSPLIEADDLRAAVASFSGRPIFCAAKENRACWAWTRSGPVFPEFMDMRSQDLPEFLVPCGGFYLIGLSELRKSRSFMSGAEPFVVESWKAVDIDTEKDLEVARCRARRLVSPTPLSL